MDFVECRISGGHQPGNKSPGPVPGIAAGGSNAVVEKKAENEVLREMRGFAYQMMDQFKVVRGDRGIKPAEERFEEEAGANRGERIRGEKKDDCGPEQGRPPSAQPRKN